jgi:hypothetical protein
MTKDDLRRLQHAIEQLRGSQSVHVATFHLTEQLSGKIWQGEAQVFDLQGHRTAPARSTKIEIRFGILTRKVVRCGIFKSRDEPVRVS